MKAAWLVSLGMVFCLGIVLGVACGGQLRKDYLVNPSFEEGEEGQVPYGWGVESSPSNDNTSFVKAKGGRPRGEDKLSDGNEAHLTVKGEDRHAWAAQTIDVNVSAPTRFTFSAWVKSDGIIRAGAYRPYVAIRAFGIDRSSGRWVRLKPVGVSSQSTLFVPRREWTKYTVSKVYPADTGRIRLDIGSYSRDVVIAVDDLTFTCGMDVPEFDVEKEAEDLTELRGYEDEDSELGVELEKLFDEVRGLLAVVGNEQTSDEDRKSAAGRLPDLVRDYFAKKEALKQALLDSLFESSTSK